MFQTVVAGLAIGAGFALGKVFADACNVGALGTWLRMTVQGYRRNPDGSWSPRC